MKSTILTKINRVQVQFKDKINIVKTEGDGDFLMDFVKKDQPRGYNLTATGPNSCNVETQKRLYQYTIYSTHIKRYDPATDNTVWFKIS